MIAMLLHSKGGGFNGRKVVRWNIIVQGNGNVDQVIQGGKEKFGNCSISHCCYD